MSCFYSSCLGSEVADEAKWNQKMVGRIEIWVVWEVVNVFHIFIKLKINKFKRLKILNVILIPPPSFSKTIGLGLSESVRKF